MYQEERIQELMTLLQSENYATVKYLAAKLHISPSSVRRDLLRLEKEGLIYRSYGGAQLVADKNRIPSFPVRARKNAMAKQLIAKKAAELVREDDVIFIDSSSTCLLLMEHLTRFRHLTVFTNSLEVLGYASQNHIHAYSTGGFLSPDNPIALTGKYAKQTLESVHADLFFFSARALSSEGIIQDCYESESAVRTKMLMNSSRHIFLCDSSKLKHHSIFQFCRLEDIHCMVCDKDPREFLIKAAENVTYLVV